jgi:hypothetical protein
VCEALVSFKIQKEPLEEMGKVKDAVAATLEYLDLVVEPFHQATVVPGQEVIRDLVSPLFECVQEAVVAAQAASSHPSLPIRKLEERSLFRQGGVKNARQFLPLLIRLL